MPSPIVEFFGWISARVVSTPEPLALLILGAILIVASVNFRSRRDRPAEPVAQPRPRRAQRTTPAASGSPLAPQQGHS